MNGSNDIIAGDFQFCTGNAFSLHGVSGKSTGDGNVCIDIIQRIIEEILNDFIFKIIVIRTFGNYLADCRQNLRIRCEKDQSYHENKDLRFDYVKR